MRYAFDLDGTLVDTRAAIFAAYDSVGVTPPSDFFGKTFKEWYTGKDSTMVHTRKNEAYRHMMCLVKPLPLMALYKSLGQPPILTGASQFAATTVLKHFQLKPSVIHYNMSVEKKISVMRAYEEGIMFEDNLEAALQMRKETKWAICHTLT